MARPVQSASFTQTNAAPKTATVVRSANLRAGPGVNYAVVGAAQASQTLTIVGSNAAGDWYQLNTGAWIAAFLVTVNPTGAAPAVTTPAGQAAKVTFIVDGDTIEAAINGQTYRVHYILIDAPEAGQPFASEASEANRRLVAGKTVYLVKDVSETDRYGRLLRYVYLADGTFVNAELVRQGYAQIATFPPDVTKEEEIRQAQQIAVAAASGLWARESTLNRGGTIEPAPAPLQQPIANCDPSYPNVCIPLYPPDLDCGEIAYRRFQVIGADPHGFDGDGDGVGCERN